MKMVGKAGFGAEAPLPAAAGPVFVRGTPSVGGFPGKDAAGVWALSAAAPSKHRARRKGWFFMVSGSTCGFVELGLDDAECGAADAVGTGGGVFGAVAELDDVEGVLEGAGVEEFDPDGAAGRGLEGQGDVAEALGGQAAVDLRAVDRDAERIAALAPAGELEHGLGEPRGPGEFVGDPAVGELVVVGPGGDLVVEIGRAHV